MTHDTTRTRNRAMLPLAAIAALLLAGCSSGFVGESWQCPLAEGGSCDSVAAADPAVPDTAAGTMLGEPLWQVRGGEPPDRGPGQAVAPSCAADCGAGFDPFAWLAQLFDPDIADGEKTSAPGPTRLQPSETPAPAALPAKQVPANPEPRAGEADSAVLPAEPDAVEMSADSSDLRTGEVVARIWIAPFVDADGVYREASHVRVVLEPARWRLGR